jgi:hypothetical protein
MMHERPGPHNNWLVIFAEADWCYHHDSKISPEIGESSQSRSLEMSCSSECREGDAAVFFPVDPWSPEL